MARLCVKFKRLFYSFCRRFCSFHRNFISTYRKFFLFYRSFNSSFCLQKAFFRALCFFEIFKRFIFGFLCPFCHFERSEKSTKIKRKLAIFGYFACAQYDKFGLLLKNNGYFHSNFKAQIQIFHSKFKAFCKFNSFHNFISKFKPYTRLFYIFTPNFLYFHSNRFQNFEKFNTRSSL